LRGPAWLLLRGGLALLLLRRLALLRLLA